jgi:organic hydroperoxide reductase OsmC/OhrA
MRFSIRNWRYALVHSDTSARGPYSKPFVCTIEWTGNTVDYDHFPRTHEVIFPLGQRLKTSSAGQIQDPVVTNPEELMAAALGTCLMLTFLAVCSKARINVVSYKDHPAATVEFVERRFRVTRVDLKPEVIIDGPVDAERLKIAMEKAHGNCIVSLSTKSEVIIEPVFKSA